MKHLKNLSIIIMLLVLCVGCEKKTNVIFTEPVVVSPKRAMLQEEVTIKIVRIQDGVNYEATFDDGTTEKAVTPNIVKHRFTESADHKVVVKVDNFDEFEKTIRVYPLLALSVAQKQFLDSNNKKIWVLDHRANTSNYSIPENSIPAIEACYAAGVEGIETDTQRTKDGQIVISHDETIDRCTNGSGRITQMTLDEIRKYNLIDRNGNVTDQKIPTLEEFLKAARGKLYVDLDYSPRTASTAEVMSIVDKLNMYEQVWFYCNSQEKTREVLSINPKAHAYCWATDFAPLKDLEGPYFVQGSFTTKGTGTNVASAVSNGMLVSLIMLEADGFPTQTIDENSLDEMLKQYPSLRMIMTDDGDILVNSLKSRGLR